MELEIGVKLMVAIIVCAVCVAGIFISKNDPQDKKKEE